MYASVCVCVNVFVFVKAKNQKKKKIENNEEKIRKVPINELRHKNKKWQQIHK